MLTNDDSARSQTDGCLAVYRVWEIACQPSLWTFEESEHVLTCSLCQRQLAEAIADVHAPGGTAQRLAVPLVLASPETAGDEQDTAADDELAKMICLRELAEFGGAFARMMEKLATEPREEIRLKYLVELARLHREMGHFDEAAAGCAALLKNPHLGVRDAIVCLNNLAWLTRQKGDQAAVSKFLDEAERRAGDSPGAYQDVLAETKHLRAVQKWMQGDVADALALIDVVLRVREEFPGFRRLDVARSLLVKAAIVSTAIVSTAIVSTRGKFDEAMKLLQEALEIRQAALGPNHAEVAEVLCRISQVHEARARWIDAISTWERAIAAFENAASSDVARAGMLRCHNGLCKIHEKLKTATAQGDRDVAAAAIQATVPGLINRCRIFLKKSGAQDLMTPV